MPKCKNKTKRNYNRKDKSPEGKGWCAEGERLNRVRIGRDRTKWKIVKKWDRIKRKKRTSKYSSNTSSNTSSNRSNSSKYSSSYSSSYTSKKKKKKTKKKKYITTSSSNTNNTDIKKYVGKAYKLLKNKSKIWWNQICNGNKVVVVFKDGKAHWESNKNHKNLKNKNIKIILWIKHKKIGLDDFVRFVLNKVTIKHIEALIVRDKPLEYILENSNIFLKKDKLYTTKDYVPKFYSRTKIDEKKIYMKLKKSTLLKNKMKQKGWVSLLF